VRVIGIELKSMSNQAIKKPPSKRSKDIAATHVLIVRYQYLVEDFLIRRAHHLKSTVRADRRELVRVFVGTGSYTNTAEVCGVGPERVRRLMFAAMRYLRSIGKAPPLEVPPQIKSSARERPELIEGG